MLHSSGGCLVSEIGSGVHEVIENNLAMKIRIGGHCHQNPLPLPHN
jgi:hypothetical protein